MFDTAIVGAGFSGAMVAVNLAIASQGRCRVALIERRGEAGRGLAYGTTDSQHLLNVRARGMSAFPDRPAHFHEWLRAHPALCEAAGVADPQPDSFVPRLIYGAYVQDILRDTQARHGGIEIVRATVSDIAPGAAGYDLFAAEGPLLAARQVVLALGNFPPGNAAIDPYAAETAARLAEAGDVFLIGTGLTSLDLLVTMARTKPTGTIHVLSRSGLFPRVHEPLQAYPSFLDPAHLPTTALALLTAVRRELGKAAAQGIGWQSVIEALRPLNQRIWRALPIAEQRKFLRRIRPYWDTHRHRAAPEIMAVRDRLEASGRLIRHTGALVSVADAPGGVAVRWQPAGGGAPQITLVRTAVACTGPQADCRRLDDALVRNLLARGLAWPDPLRLGFYTVEDGALIDGNGEIVPGLYTIGTWRKGQLYESVAVPELRGQAADLAFALAGRP